MPCAAIAFTFHKSEFGASVNAPADASSRLHNSVERLRNVRPCNYCCGYRTAHPCTVLRSILNNSCLTSQMPVTVSFTRLGFIRISSGAHWPARTSTTTRPCTCLAGLNKMTLPSSLKACESTLAAHITWRITVILLIVNPRTAAQTQQTPNIWLVTVE